MIDMENPTGIRERDLDRADVEEAMAAIAAGRGDVRATAPMRRPHAPPPRTADRSADAVTTIRHGPHAPGVDRGGRRIHAGAAYVREHPLPLIGVAAGLGFLAGLRART